VAQPAQPAPGRPARPSRPGLTPGGTPAATGRHFENRTPSALRRARAQMSWARARRPAGAADPAMRPGRVDSVRTATSSTGWSWALRVDRLAPGQHLHELFDAPDAGLHLFCVSDPIQNGVPIRTCQCLEHCLGPRVGQQGVHEILRNFHVGLSGVGGRPPTVCLRLPHLDITRWMHSARNAQPLGDGDIPLRPRAPRGSRCESSPECLVVTTPQLPINPAEADRFIECFVVDERRRMCRTLLGEDEPDSFCIGVIAQQPAAPFGGIGNQKLWKIWKIWKIHFLKVSR